MFTSETLRKLIRGGETSHVQFKGNISNLLSAAQELVAFANTEEGLLLVGVQDGSNYQPWFRGYTAH